MATNSDAASFDRDAPNDANLPWLEPAMADDIEEEGFLSLKTMVAFGVLFLLLFVGFVYFFYNQMVSRGVSQPVRSGGALVVVRAPDTPYKVSPAQAGGAPLQDNVSYPSIQELQGGARDNGAMAEPAEEPAFPQTLTPPRGPEVANFAEPRGDVSPPAYATPSYEPEPAPAYEPAPVQPAPYQPAPAAPVVAEPQPAPAVPEPVVVAQPATPAPVSPPAAPVVAQTGGYVLQLGAFSSQARAENGWEIYRDKYPSVLNSLGADIVSAQSNGRTIYRLRGGSVPTQDEAKTLCEQLRGLGQGCMVVQR